MKNQPTKILVKKGVTSEDVKKFNATSPPRIFVFVVAFFLFIFIALSASAQVENEPPYKGRQISSVPDTTSDITVYAGDVVIFSNQSRFTAENAAALSAIVKKIGVSAVAADISILLGVSVDESIIEGIASGRKQPSGYLALTIYLYISED